MRERVVVCLTSEKQEYQALQGADARAAGERLGVETEVVFADDNAVMQIQQLFRFVHGPEAERPIALLVHTRVPDGLERVARNAARAGIAWFLLNRSAPYLETLRQEHPGLALAAASSSASRRRRASCCTCRALPTRPPPSSGWRASRRRPGAGTSCGC
jgi:ABC-type sugar transport system substrate-binding protein